MNKLTNCGLIAIAFLTTASPAVAQPGDPIFISVSLADQYMRVFRGDEEIASSNISSGKSGHETPTGIFSILQKNRHHRSNIYSNAPMPFMQRLTWSGIALHSSNHVPRSPASHGCVRMPHKFAGQLFKMASMGMHVVIEDDPQLPSRFDHQTLFKPKVTWEVSANYDRWVNQHIEAANSGFATSDQRYPARIFVTRRTAKDDLFDAQRLLNKLGFDAGTVDGIMGPATWSAVEDYRNSKAMNGGGKIDHQLMAALFKDANEPMPANGRILVRKHHRTIFESEIHIKEEHKPLGSHLLTVTGFDRSKGKTGWMAVSMWDRIQADFNLNELVSLDRTTSRHSLSSAFERIQMSKHDHEQIERFLSPGSSITISDNGISIETGAKGTDFIVLTDPDETTGEIASSQTGQSG